MDSTWKCNTLGSEPKSGSDRSATPPLKFSIQRQEQNEATGLQFCLLIFRFEKCGSFR